MSLASEECLRWLKANVDTDDALDWLLHAPIEYLLCRQRHLWPELVPGPLPPGMTWEPAPDLIGCYELTLLCPRCKMQKIELTGIGGVIIGNRYRRYYQPEGYKADQCITPTICATEVQRRRAVWEETHSVRQ